ncbi:MAG: hypothetical protein QNK37_34030 [Acidobacteriota bacterium]|nr:hypothetical protein [Acidobacteriota bacterium]
MSDYVAFKAELSCFIIASLDEGGTIPIPNGDNVVNGPVWLHFYVRNKGWASAINFKVQMVVVKNGWLVHNNMETLSIPNSLTPTIQGPKFSVKVNGVGKIQAFLLVDVLETVPELDEQNNFADFECKVHKLW